MPQDPESYPQPGLILPPEPIPASAPLLAGAPIFPPPGPLPEPPSALQQSGPTPIAAGPGGPPQRPAAGSPPAYALPPRRSAAPLILGCLIVVLLLLAAAAWYFTHVDGRSVLTGGTLSPAADGLHYRNARENIAFIAPASWSNYPTSTAQVMLRGNGCSFGLLEQHTVLQLSRLADAEAKDLHRRHP